MFRIQTSQKFVDDGSMHGKKFGKLFYKRCQVLQLMIPGKKGNEINVIIQFFYSRNFFITLIETRLGKYLLLFNKHAAPSKVCRV